jgi:ABC-2 type transport system permease protein
VLAASGVPAGSEVQVVAFTSVEAARAALDAGQIGAFYVLPADYPASRQADLVYYKAPSEKARRAFRDALRLRLLAGQPAALVERVLAGADVTVRATEARRDYPAGGPSAGLVVPLIVALVFAFLTMTASGYMMQVLVDEKENRTIEVLVSSVSPRQMMAGKITGAIGLSLLQLGVWLACIGGAAWLGANVLDIGWLQSIEVNWRDHGLLAVAAVPAFLCLAGLMTAVGATLGDSQDVQQVGPLLFLVLLLPFYLAVPIAQNPNGPLATALSLVPFTAVMTIAVRSVFVEVPAWQFFASAAVSLAGAAGAVWLAAAAFRMGMLRYGKRLKWRELFARERTA